MKILLCFNESFAPHAAAVITGLIKHSSKKLSFAIFYTEMEGLTIDKFETYYQTSVESIEFYKIDINSDLAIKFKSINSQEHLSGKIEPYLRLFAPLYLQDDEVVYLDCDIIIKGDITKMLDEVDRRYCVCGVNEHDPLHKMRDFGLLDEYTTPKSFEDYFYRDAFFYRLKHYYGMSKDSKYMNDGIMFMNLKKWREDDLLSKMMKKIDETDLFYSADQDLLNSVIDGEYGVLSPKWNSVANFVGITSNYTSDQLKVSNISPCIIHTVGPRKAWIKGTNKSIAKEYWECRKNSPWPDYSPIVDNNREYLLIRAYRRIMRLLANMFDTLSNVGINKRKHTFASVYSNEQL